MNTKELILPDDWEVKEVVGNKIILKEKNTELPKTWKECAIAAITFNDLDDMTIQLEKDEHKVIPKGFGKPVLALCQLLVCRNAWWKHLGWKPDWKDTDEHKFCIGFIKGRIDTFTNEGTSRMLAFPTSEVRDQFLDSFRDLIEEAKELL